jgi:hypothetical protein
MGIVNQAECKRSPEHKRPIIGSRRIGLNTKQDVFQRKASFRGKLWGQVGVVFLPT